MKVEKKVLVTQFLKYSSVLRKCLCRLASRILENREIANVRKLKSKFMGQSKNGCKMKETDYIAISHTRGICFQKRVKNAKRHLVLISAVPYDEWVILPNKKGLNENRRNSIASFQANCVLN